VSYGGLSKSDIISAIQNSFANMCVCQDCSYFRIISVLSVYHVSMFYVHRDGE